MIHGFWIKRLTALHERIKSQIQACINAGQLPANMCHGRTVLIQKSKEGGNIPSNFRPITCLSNIYKLVTAIIKEAIYNHLMHNNVIPLEQKGCLKNYRGCKDHLLLDKLITNSAKRHQRNLSMGWLDVRKAYDSVSHTWIRQMLSNLKVAPNIQSIISNSMTQWKTTLQYQGKNLGEIKINRGIFQGDALSPLLFITCLIPLTWTLK